MPVEFIGMISTRDQSETRGPVVRSLTATTCVASLGPTRTPALTGSSSGTARLSRTASR